MTQLTAGVEARAPQAKIENPDIGTAFADEFGIGLSLWKETVAIGVPSDGDVHVYVNVGGHWIQQARLGGLETYSGSNSSLAVGLYEDTLVAGSRMGDGGAINAGGAVVFTRNGDTWTSRATLLPGDPVRSGQVGGSVGLWGDTAILGTSDLAATPPGRAYVFHRVGEAWTQQAKLLPDDLEAGDFFGWSVAIHADTAIVGAHYGDSATSNNGSAYIFERSGGIWTQVAKLVPPDPDVFDQFGYSVAIHGDRAVVGSVNGDSPVLNSGTAHVYRRDGGAWVEEATLAPPDPAGPIAFGLGVAIWGDTIAVGAPSDDSGATNAGAVLGGLGSRSARGNIRESNRRLGAL